MQKTADRKDLYIGFTINYLTKQSHTKTQEKSNTADYLVLQERGKSTVGVTCIMVRASFWGNLAECMCVKCCPQYKPQLSVQ